MSQTAAALAAPGPASRALHVELPSQQTDSSDDEDVGKSCEEEEPASEDEVGRTAPPMEDQHSGPVLLTPREVSDSMDNHVLGPSSVISGNSEMVQRVTLTAGARSPLWNSTPAAALSSSRAQEGLLD